ncbi:hypothetical protein GCM10010156_64910 [Planobispora rosea]|uniref:Uncharacterized protein n=1 Tax=Planobispora rosea TaxID=35762 RepID=A0A8J3WFV1_PLARO|nr:hypothetical protein [Planobispora rosea]GGS97735.1 hypothetical protein GCM10010156_64910 [Planobispora rosea]GIH87830.1 hypothetical protein Pro02_62380 [Planobispora rosea]
MLLFEIAFAIAVIAGITRLARNANRPERLRRVPPPPRRRSSWLVKAWNASGAPRINGSTLGDASAELTGKAVGATARGGAWLTGRASRATARHVRRVGQAASQRAQLRWQVRMDGEDAPGGMWWRLQPAPESQDAPHDQSQNQTSAETEVQPGRRWRVLRFDRRRQDTDEPTPQTPESAAPERHPCTRCHSTTELTRFSQRRGRWLCHGCLRALEPLPGAEPTGAPSSSAPPNGRPASQPNAQDVLRAVPHPLPRPTGRSTSDTTSTSTDPVPGAPGAFAKGPTMTQTAGTVTSVAPPADWIQIIARITEHAPADDTELLQLMAGEVAGVCGYADALGALHETCVNTVGLDPSSVQGLAEYSASATELAARMVEAHKQFLTVYAEVMEAVARGVVLPYQGRWFTGAA